jgi:hypothetical protein
MLGEENLYVPKAVASENRIPFVDVFGHLCLVFRYQDLLVRDSHPGVLQPSGFQTRSSRYGRYKRKSLVLMKPGENSNVWIGPYFP